MTEYYDDDSELPNFVLEADIGSLADSDEMIDNIFDVPMEIGAYASSDEDLLAATTAMEDINHIREENLFENSSSANYSELPCSLGETERFPKLTGNERESIIEGSTSKGTKKMTKYGVNVFIDWLIARKMSTKFEDLSVPDLDRTLKEFYSEVRSTDGKLYAKSTYVGIRAAINRHLRSPPHNKKFNILTDSDFHLSNQMFNSMLKKIQAEGLHKATHYPPITEGDIEKLRKSEILSINSAKTLQYKVWFSLMLHLGRRGRENLRNFTDNTFHLKSDDRGFEYVEMMSSETTKNHQGDHSDKSFETKPRMYATSCEKDCPVIAFKKYIEKRNPASNYFFQQPRPRVKESDRIWYTSRPVGEKTLNSFMRKISEGAKLSQVYTNHSVRATTVKVLAHSGVPNRKIMKITGHKCEASLDSYNADSSDHQKRSYSGILSGKYTQGESQNMMQIQPCHMPTYISLQPSMSLSPYIPPNQQLTIPNVSNLSVSYQKQFEIHNSSVQVFNYHLGQQ